MAQLRRAAESYGLWVELAEVYDGERERLASWAPGPLRNWAGRVVGELEVLAG